MYIINYKALNKGFYSGLSISKLEKEEYYSYFEEDGFGKCNYLIPEFDFEGKISGEEQVRKYIRDYYFNVLSKLDPKQVYDDFQFQRLVTFDDGEFSHGYILAAWFELYLDVKVMCIDKVDLCVKNLIDLKPKWTMDVLEEEIKKTIDDMKGFNSVRALYLFEQSEELENKACELEDKIINTDWSSGKYDDILCEHSKMFNLIDNYRQEACYRRCDADMAEDAWREKRIKLNSELKKKSRKK